MVKSKDTEAMSLSFSRTEAASSPQGQPHIQSSYIVLAHSCCLVLEPATDASIIVHFQMNQAPFLTPTAEQVTDKPMQADTPANVENLFARGRQLASLIQKPITLMTRSEIEAMLRREKEKTSISSIA